MRLGLAILLLSLNLAMGCDSTEPAPPPSPPPSSPKPAPRVQRKMAPTLAVVVTADLSEDHIIYPTTAPSPEQRAKKNPDHDRKKVFPGETPEDNVTERTTENLGENLSP